MHALAQPPAPPNLRPARRQGWLGTAGVAAGLAFTVFGGFLLGGGAGAAGGDVQTGQPYEVFQGVLVTPAAGWAITETTEGRVVLQGNGGFMLVTAASGTVDPPATVVDTYLSTQQALAEAASFSRGATEPFTVASGPGAQASYVGVFDGSPLEGAVYVIVTPSGLGITLDGYAAQGRYYPGLADQVAAMVGSVQAS